MKISLKLFFFPLAFLPFLWDYYIFGLKIFDIVAILIGLFCLIFVSKEQIREKSPSRIYLFLYFFTFFSIIGFINYFDFKGFSGLMLGILYFYLMILFFEKEDIKKQSFYILTILLFTFFIQFLSTIFFNEPINFHRIVGDSPRLETAVGFRTSGLFLEPTSYCAMMFMTLVLRFLLNSFTKYEFFGVLSIPLSFSLYGVFLFIILIGYWALKKFRKRFLFSIGVIFIVPIIFLFTQGSNFASEGTQIYQIFERVNSISSDISVVSRYSGSQESNSLVSIIFGNGLSTVGGSRLGNFGLGYLISGVGIFGLMILIVIYMDLFRKKLFYVFSSFFVILLSSYYWTFLVFWMWMAWIYIILKNSSYYSINAQK
tara:strand:- start:5646 stop:6758 length:1113 start_codon:yes stop_codon:yes gene_type:complete